VRAKTGLDLSAFTDRRYKTYMLLAYTRDEMFRARTKELRKYSILPRQASVLMAIDRLGSNATPTEISKLLIRDSQTVAGILNRMEKQGLIKRTKDPNNGKSIKIIATPKSRQAFLQSVKHESINRIMDCLGEEEMQQLESILLKLHESSIHEKKRLGKNT
jgi:MarR family transcriptional regulator, organic hydroperoxide resistance regulator